MIKKFFSKKSNNKERTDPGYGWSGRYMHWEDVKISYRLYIATKNDLKLKVIDFGGSLGTTSWQGRIADFFKTMM